MARAMETGKRDDRIVRLYGQGLSCAAVGERVGMTWSGVTRVLIRRGVPRRTSEDLRKPLKKRDDRIVALYRKGLTCEAISGRVGFHLESVRQALIRRGVARRRRKDDWPELKARNDRIVRLYRDGLSLHQVAPKVGMTWSGVLQVLVRRGVARRSSADLGKANKARDDRIIALYRRGMPCRAIAPMVGLSSVGVQQVLVRRGEPRKPPGWYPSPDRESWKRYRDRVEEVKHLYDTGPGTSAVDLARKIGMAPGTVRKHLVAMGVDVRDGGGRGSLNVETARRIKQGLVEGEPFEKLGLRHGVGRSVVAAIARGHTWKHVPWPVEGGYIPRHTTKLTEAKARRIKAELVDGRMSFTELARRYGVTTSTINAVATGRTWRDAPWPDHRRYEGRPPGERVGQLTAERVARVKADLVNGDLSFAALARLHGIGKITVNSIAMGHRWGHVPWPGGRRYVSRGHGRPNKLTPEKVRRIKVELVEGTLTMSELAERYGINTTGICSIAMGKSWKQVPWPAGRRYVRRPSGRRPQTDRTDWSVLRQRRARRRKTKSGRWGA